VEAPKREGEPKGAKNMQAKRFIVGLAMTAVSMAVIFFLINRFAPPAVKQFFVVS
jgi:hypothetical protein